MDAGVATSSSRRQDSVCAVERMVGQDLLMSVNHSCPFSKTLAAINTVHHLACLFHRCSLKYRCSCGVGSTNVIQLGVVLGWQCICIPLISVGP